MRDREHITLLRFVAPDLARRHPGLLARHIAEIDHGPDATTMRQLGQRVRQSAGADVVDRQDRIRIAHLPAAVDDFLRATLHLRVAALHRIEIEIGCVVAGGHARCRAAAQANQHPGAAQLKEEVALDQRLLERVDRLDVADATRDHDRLVKAERLAAVRDLERAKVAEKVRTTELVVECGATDRPVEHDVERRRDPVGLGRRRRLPWLDRTRQPQVRRRETGQPGLRLGADAGCAFIANLATRPCRRAGKRRDRRRMIVRLDLHQDVRRHRVRAVNAIAVGMEAPDVGTLDDRRVIRICDDGSRRRHFVRVPNHREQRLRLRLAVDDPVGIEYLVPAMLRVRLREHHQLDVGRIAAGAREVVGEIVDLVGRQREAHVDIGALDRNGSVAQQRDARLGLRRDVIEQCVGRLERIEDAFGHPVMDQREQPRVVDRLVGDGKSSAALDPRNGVEAAIAGDVGRFRRPRRDRTDPWNDESQPPFRLRVFATRSVGQQSFESARFDSR